MGSTPPSRAAAVAKATGRPWDEWVALLDERGADRMDHAAIARLTGELMPDHVTPRGWWAQGAAIAYQQQKEMRVPGQSSTGDFQVSASRTVPGDKDRALLAWQALADTHESFGGVAVDGATSTSSTDKWRYWRCRLVDGSRVSVTISDKGDRARVAIGHTKLASSDDVERWRGVWKDLLAQL